MKPSIATFLLSFTFSLFGCAASGPLFTQPIPLNSSSSEIIVYRPDRFAAGGATYYIHLDGKEVASLDNAGFVAIPASPGAHQIEIRASIFKYFKPIKVNFETTGGARIYFRFEPHPSGLPIITPTVAVIPIGFAFMEVPPEQALVELRTLRLSE